MVDRSHQPVGDWVGRAPSPGGRPDGVRDREVLSQQARRVDLRVPICRHCPGDGRRSETLIHSHPVCESMQQVGVWASGSGSAGVESRPIRAVGPATVIGQ